jgi:hypothetical protein
VTELPSSGGRQSVLQRCDELFIDGLRLHSYVRVCVRARVLACMRVERSCVCVCLCVSKSAGVCQSNCIYMCERECWCIYMRAVCVCVCGRLRVHVAV